MDFMGFHIVDMIIVGLVLFLAVRGLVNGFSKELFNFLALIGGIAIAARTHSAVGKFIAEQNILPDLSSDFQKLVGFATVLILILIIFNIISSLRTKFRTESPGFFSRFFGYLIGVARYIFIFSLIIFGINNADFLREKLAKHYEGSQLFAPMIQLGGELLNANKTSDVESTKNNTTTENNTSNENNDTNQSDNNLSMNLNIKLTDHNESTENNKSNLDLY
jgi:membrane protein required for colicin V production